MKTSNEVALLFEALAKAQAEMKAVPFDSKNPHFKNEFASLTAIQEATRPMLSKNGLAVVQTLESDGDIYWVSTTLGHSSGQFCQSSLKLLMARPDMQSLGSSCTYAKRYQLQAMLNVCGDEDDDGEASVGRALPPKSTSPPPRAPVPPPENQDDTGPFPPNETDEGAFNQDPGKYVIKFGRKYFDKTIAAVGYAEIKSYVEWIETSAKQSGKPPAGKVEEFIYFAKEFLANEVPF